MIPESSVVCSVKDREEKESSEEVEKSLSNPMNRNVFVLRGSVRIFQLVEKERSGQTDEERHDSSVRLHIVIVELLSAALTGERGVTCIAVRIEDEIRSNRPDEEESEDDRADDLIVVKGEQENW